MPKNMTLKRQRNFSHVNFIASKPYHLLEFLEPNRTRTGIPISSRAYLPPKVLQTSLVGVLKIYGHV